MHFLDDEGSKLKLSFIAGVLSASVIALSNYDQGNNLRANQITGESSSTSGKAAALGAVIAGVASAYRDLNVTSDTSANSAASSTTFALVTGYFNENMTFYNANTASITLTKATGTDSDVFIAKINGDGNWIWAVNVGSASNDVGYSITALR